MARFILNQVIVTAIQRRGWRVAPAGLYETVKPDQWFVHPFLKDMVVRDYLNRKQDHKAVASLLR